MKWISRRSYALYFYGCFIAFLVVRYFDGLFLSQISQNPIRSPRVDLIVWIVQALNIPELVSNLSVGLCLDGMVILLPLLILYRLVLDKKINSLALVLTVIFGFYILIIYCYPTLSIRKYLGLVLIPIAFVFSSDQRYFNYLQLMRYYVCFVFTSASLWKILRGVAWDSTHMQLSLKSQHIDNIINWPDHLVTQWVSLVMADPIYSKLLLILAIFSQVSFAIGFFTKKYDQILAFLLVLFIISDYLVMRIEYWEFIVFLPLLLNKDGYASEDHGLRKLTLA
jgi:hypothetical protein